MAHRPGLPLSEGSDRDLFHHRGRDTCCASRVASRSAGVVKGEGRGLSLRERATRMRARVAEVEGLRGRVGLLSGADALREKLHVRLSGEKSRTRCVGSACTPTFTTPPWVGTAFGEIGGEVDGGAAAWLRLISPSSQRISCWRAVGGGDLSSGTAVVGVCVAAADAGSATADGAGANAAV